MNHTLEDPLTDNASRSQNPNDKKNLSTFKNYVVYNMLLMIGITVPKALFGKGPFTWTKVFFLTQLDLTKNLRPSKFQSGAT